ncbi:MAG TPA: penicillin-binding transpeptidase domain-containing protein [Clostridia bacterium]|nr:penicillin-binding transpeptidase domain-containing protein [Clostridia bacterium]
MKSNKKNIRLDDYKKTIKKRSKLFIFIVYFLMFLIIIKVGWLQFVNGSTLKEAALKQQTTNRILSPKRGTIYDSTGKSLALSAEVDTVTINPQKFVDKNSYDKTTERQKSVSQAFSTIFELDYNSVYEKVTSNTTYQTIVKKVEEDKINKLKEWQSETKIYSGINIDSDTKRYYPYNNLGSNLIGFCGDDNQGLSGLEYYWDSILTGTPGKISTTQDASQSFISDENEKYIAPENGSNIKLTLDLNIQTIAEKYLKQGVIENNCDGGNVIIMNPQTGDILGMATYPDYNLNTPFEPNESLSKTWNNLDNNLKSSALQKMWKNTAVSNTYEPGSTFKLIVASTALEEGVTTTDVSGDFFCDGTEQVAEYNIKCTSTTGHGLQTLRQALQNSCNPAFIQLGKRIGATTLYKYIEAFGLFDKTGIQTSGEIVGVSHKINNVGPVELATISFGQRFTITPIQLITSVCAIANDGYLMTPRIVKEIENTDTGTITTIKPNTVRQVISSETAAEMCDMMESVVVNGGGKYGQVKGYSVGGKTGTSEPSPDKKEEGYVASFVAISPTENAEVVVLATFYNPKGKSYYGSTVAAPVAAQILSEILPYLEIPSEESTNNITSSTQLGSNFLTKNLPDVKNKTFSEAKKILEDSGFKCNFSGNNDEIITEQVPKPGVPLYQGSIVKIYSTSSSTRTSIQVPDLKGLTYLQAKNSLSSKNLNIKIVGTSGKVISQDITAGSSVEEGTVITITLQEELSSTAR